MRQLLIWTHKFCGTINPFSTPHEAFTRQLLLSALETIKSLVGKADTYRDAPANLGEWQLEALRERFTDKRQELKILDRRASEVGVEEIRTLAGVVPLLFFHTNYKRYPESYVDKDQWSNMSLWLQTLTS